MARLINLKLNYFIGYLFLCSRGYFDGHYIPLVIFLLKYIKLETIESICF